MQLRVDQLEFRREEIYHAVTAFRQFVNDPSSNHGLYMVNTDEYGCNLDAIFAESFKEAVNLDSNFAITGHSFGGATSVIDSVLSKVQITSSLMYLITAFHSLEPSAIQRRRTAVRGTANHKGNHT